MTTATQIILTDEQIKAIDDGQLVTIPATWEEFMDFLPTTHYKTEYARHHIIIMGLAILLHEWLVSRVCWILINMYQKQPNVLVLSSNLGVSRPEKSYFNPDVTVVKESPEFYRSSKAIIKNPFMVVEVLSDSTANYDWKVKLMRYQNMESMQQIVFIDPDDVCVTVSSRSTEPNVWTMITYYNPTDMVTIDGHTFPLSHFFEGMPTFQ